MDILITACVLFAILFAGIFIRSLDMQTIASSSSSDDVSFENPILDDDDRRMSLLHSYELDNVYHNTSMDDSHGRGFYGDE